MHKIGLFIFLALCMLTGTAINSQEIYNVNVDCNVREITHEKFRYSYEMWNDQEGRNPCMYIKSNGDVHARWKDIAMPWLENLKRTEVSNQRIDFKMDIDHIKGNTFLAASGWWGNEGVSKLFEVSYNLEGYYDMTYGEDQSEVGAYITA